MRSGNMLTIKTLGSNDAAILERAVEGVFDQAVQPALVTEFLADPRHYLIVAQHNDSLIGFVSAISYLHPDKPLELWINEISVAATHQRQGLGTRLMRAMLELGRELGCRQAWVLTERSNPQAMRLYASAGGVIADETVMYNFEL